MNLIKIFRYEKSWTLLFFIAYLILGLNIYQDYGLSWDEPISRLNGLVNVKYIAENLFPFLLTDSIKTLPDLHNWMDRDYGVAFETPAVVLERLFNLEETKEIFIYRHLVTFLFSFLGVVAIYATCKKIYGDYRLGLLAALMLVLSPRIFAESFYNSKDIVFMASIAIAIYTMTNFLAKHSLLWASIHGFCTALAIDIRIMGILLLLCTLGALAVQLAKRAMPTQQLRTSAEAYILATCIFVIVMFPFLWADPLGNFVLIFKNMANFRWDGSVLYMGEIIKATNLPWHYIPVWILITTPPLYIVFMLIGMFATLKQFISRKFSFWSGNKEMYDMIHLAILTGPIIAVVALASVLYDGWRQLYFIYPAFILLSIKGVVTVLNFFKDKKPVKYFITGIFIVSFSYSGYWIWAAHPLQNIYFNFLIGNDWKNKFELDYWGLGNREALQYIVDNDPSPTITVGADSATPLNRAVIMLDKKDATRIVLSDKESKPLYLLTNYRLVIDKDDRKYSNDYDLFYQKIVFGETILSVFKRKKTANLP
ncbi:MAG TPA: glycosyltransferase family 39 protein [Methylotenera sp.]|jgi:hypothetical protein